MFCLEQEGRCGPHLGGDGENPALLGTASQDRVGKIGVRTPNVPQGGPGGRTSNWSTLGH